ncbi:MAG: hypothetical protein ACRDM9_14240, partial [Gaiellaceae bacterium]
MLGGGLGEQPGCALEEDRGGAPVAPVERPPPRSRQQPAGTSGAPAIALRHGAQLAPVPKGLLEVVADDLLKLDQLGAARLEPQREALVELGASGFGQSLVGGVPDQQVA